MHEVLKPDHNGPRALGASFLDERLRQVSARTTESIVRRYGDRLGMWVGCGYPKSGTVWLCNLLASYLDLPHPRQYRLPLAMPCVVHAHWLPDPRLPPTVYIVRDGRDVMVSWYFREVKLANSTLNPAAARRRRDRFERVLGAKYDLRDAVANLPRVMEAELVDPSWMSANWPTHVQAWMNAPPERVGIVRYEDLLQDVVSALGPLLERLTGRPLDTGNLKISEERFDFSRQSRSVVGNPDASPFMRKGVSGDWKLYFDDSATTIFDQAAGDVLESLGYERTAAR